jgi:5-aminopentanamidase
MRIAVIQFQPAFKDLETNLARIEVEIATTDADVIVFPELATSGYFFRSTQEALPYALTIDSPEIHGLVRFAQQHHRIVVCGFAERDGDTLYNSALIGGHGIDTRVYRKSHLFYREVDVFTPGDTGFFVTPIPHLDCNLGVMICYDWRFPESARTLALKGADLIACPSNLVTNIWRMAMPVRALENKVYLAVANRTGEETNLDETVAFNGDSVIYGYNGSVITAANPTDDATLVAEIDPAKTRDKSFNAVNDIFADRRPSLYE